METVERLHGLLEAATPGPWVQTQEIDGVFSGRQTVIKAGSDDSPAFPYRRVVTVGQTRQHFHIKAEDNVALIAAMHAALPALLDIAEAAKVYADELWAEEYCCRECADAGKEPSREYAALRDALSRLEGDDGE